MTSTCFFLRVPLLIMGENAACAIRDDTTHHILPLSTCGLRLCSVLFLLWFLRFGCRLLRHNVSRHLHVTRMMFVVMSHSSCLTRLTAYNSSIMPESACLYRTASSFGTSTSYISRTKAPPCVCWFAPVFMLVIDRNRNGIIQV